MSSSAVPILRPTTSDFVPGAAGHDSPTKSTPRARARRVLPRGADPRASPPEDKKLCRNVLIYGQCRFEDTGCLFSHDAVSRACAPACSSRMLTETNERRAERARVADVGCSVSAIDWSGTAGFCEAASELIASSRGEAEDGREGPASVRTSSVAQSGLAA